MKPYYQNKWATIYHGDARKILPTLEIDSILTDPVWPNASRILKGSENPFRLWEETMEVLPNSTKLLTVHLGCMSDPRFLASIPRRLSFFRVCWLRFIPVSFSGKVLNGNDVAYVFGNAPGSTVIGGECPISNEPPLYPKGHGRNRNFKTFEKSKNEAPHPCPRKLAHVKWLAKRFAFGVTCDPFVGTGSTLLACLELEIPSIGIDIEEKYCEIAAKRVDAEGSL